MINPPKLDQQEFAPIAALNDQVMRSDFQRFRY
jgi:hypothetical protein